MSPPASLISFQEIVFDRIIGDSHLELLFTRFLEDCEDVVSYAKNYCAIHFKLDHIDVSGNISNYYPGFIVKLADGRVVFLETKGVEDLDMPLKTEVRVPGSGV